MVNYAGSVMNTIPLTFNEKQIERTILGGTEKNPYASHPVSVVVLTREISHYKNQIFESLMKNGFESIISVEHHTDNYSIDELSRTYPCVKFIIPHEKISTGEKINISMSETESPYVLILWDDIKTRVNMFSDLLLNRLHESNAVCLSPVLLNDQMQNILVKMKPFIKKASFSVIPGQVLYDSTPTLYNFDFIGIYNREKFIQLGGFDYTITSSYWQNLDFCMRSWLWGEKIICSPLFRLSYEDTSPVEDSTIDISYLRFYLKNLLPLFKNDYAYIPVSSFLGFARRASSLFNSFSLFKSARSWVETNKYRFKTDASALISQWDEKKE